MVWLVHRHTTASSQCWLIMLVSILGTWLVLGHGSLAQPSSCTARGYTECQDVCCGRNSSSGEPACCLEHNAVCCNRPSLAEQSNRFFCCPPSLPVCDFDAATCRAPGSRKRPVLVERRLVDLHRALTKRPRSAFQGSGVGGSSQVLNKHLHRNVESHGHQSYDKLKPCEDFTLESLHATQRLIRSHRAPVFNNVYNATNDRRFVSRSHQSDYEQLWSEDLKVAEVHSSLRASLRDGQCFETVMLYVHHLSHELQRFVLDEVSVLPLLPAKPPSHDIIDNTQSVPTSTLRYVQERVAQQVGCGACHVSNITAGLEWNAAQCPSATATQCMQLDRLHCSTDTANATLSYQCCPGLLCTDVFIPASEMAFSMNTTRCVVNASLQEAYSMYDESGDITPLLPFTQVQHQKREENAATTKTPPVLPASWRANGTYYNITSPNPERAAGSVNFLYQENGIGNQSTLRADFSPVCPFKQLWKSGLHANYGPCSVIYRNNTVSYAYHGVRTCIYCSEDAIPPWHRDFMCRAGSNYLNISISSSEEGTMQVDLWQFEWWWTTFLVLRNYRNWYFLTDSNTPVRVEEDLDTGYTDFDHFEEVPYPGISDEEMMSGISGSNVSYIAGLHGTRPCPGPDERRFVKAGDLPECTFVHGIPLRRTWPQRQWPPT